MKNIVIGLAGCEHLASSVATHLRATSGSVVMHNYPDGEVGVRLLTDVRGCAVVVVAALDRPSLKILPLYFLLDLLKSSGAVHITLVAPYLPYMRQDKQFNDGEAVTSAQFARLLSEWADKIVTVDPHLHRYASLDEIYGVPTVVVHAASRIADWIKQNVVKPVIVGPDGESKQWVARVAQEAGAPYVVLEKERLSDVDVHLHLPTQSQFDEQCTPVMVDDIISTAHTMIALAKTVVPLAVRKPVCVGVHAVFSDDALHGLHAAGVERVVTTNSLSHVTNAIDISNDICDALL